MANPPNDPHAPPPRPQRVRGNPPHRTPGLPQSTQNNGRDKFDESPSEAIVAAGKRTVTIQDSLGRSITIKRMGARDRMLIAKALGDELAKNTTYFGYAVLAATVVELDNGSGEDTRCPPMIKPSEFEFMVDRLGDEGLTAIGEAYKEHFADQFAGPDVDTAKN